MSHYTIVRQLDGGQGRMAQVYQAINTEAHTQQTVALKIANIPNRQGEYYTRALQNEVEQLRQLHHPQIIKLLPITCDAPVTFLAQANLPGQPWFAALEYLPYDSLATQLLNPTKGLALNEVLGIGYALAGVLDYLHARQRIHLDIKPANLLFRRPSTSTARAEIVLIDFGSACRSDQIVTDTQTTFRASPYLAPEWQQTAQQGSKGQLRAMPSLDIYALGATLYQTLTGQLPTSLTTSVAFNGLAGFQPTTERVLDKQKERKPLGLRAFAQRLDEVILATLHPDPVRRPSAGLVAEQLAELQQQWGPAPAQPDKPETQASPAGQRWWPVALCFLAGLGFGAGAQPLLNRLEAQVILPTLSATPIIRATDTPTTLPTATPMSTTTATAPPTATPRPTATPSPPPTPTVRPTHTPTATPTFEPTPTPVSTLAPTWTPTGRPLAKP